jgi:hypothetical protein
MHRIEKSLRLRDSKKIKGGNTMTKNEIFKEQERIFEIKDLLKNKYGLTANVGYRNTIKNTREIDVTFNGEDFKGLEIYALSPNDEIIARFEHALFFDKWDVNYKLNLNTIVLKTIFDQYGLSDQGFIVSRNEIIYFNTEFSIMNKILYTSEIKGFEVNTNRTDEGYIYFIGLTIKTNYKSYVFNNFGLNIYDEEGNLIRE